jgi:1,2-dihydroxy-3-keto-5-methylthiopentene dioxygenase
MIRRIPAYLSTDHASIAPNWPGSACASSSGRRAQPIEPGAEPEAVMAAYRADIDRLVAENGLQAAWTWSASRPDHPEREAMRGKFLDEHYHKEDEVRFFVAGSGLFTLHVGDKVYEIQCDAGDLIAVP